MTEISWSFTLYHAGAVVTSGAFSTIDLSFPARFFEELVQKYKATKMVAIDSRGQIWEKEWP